MSNRHSLLKIPLKILERTDCYGFNKWVNSNPIVQKKRLLEFICYTVQLINRIDGYILRNHQSYLCTG